MRNSTANAPYATETTGNIIKPSPGSTNFPGSLITETFELQNVTVYFSLAASRECPTSATKMLEVNVVSAYFFGAAVHLKDLKLQCNDWPLVEGHSRQTGGSTSPD